MSSVKYLREILEKFSDDKNCIYTVPDLRQVFPGHKDASISQILSRAVKQGFMERICKGYYLYNKVRYVPCDVLVAVAARMRADHFNYISLENVLSSHSIISQQMPNWLTIMTTGRSGVIDCGRFGTIEFIHNNRSDDEIVGNLVLTADMAMPEANDKLAYSDLKRCRRQSLELVDRKELESVFNGN